MTPLAFPKPTREERKKKSEIDTSELALPKEHYDRSEAYLAYVRKFPCALLAGDCHGPIQACHLEHGGRGIKGDDASCVPLCSLAHHLQLDLNQLGGFDLARLWRRAWQLNQQWCRMHHRSK